MHPSALALAVCSRASIQWVFEICQGPSGAFGRLNWEAPLGVTSPIDLNLEIEVPNQTRYLRLVGNIAEQVAKEVEASNGDRDTLAYHLNLVLTEAVANVIQHDAQSDPTNKVKVCLSIENKDLVARVYDHGQGFDLAAVPTLDFADLDEHGRGIFVIRSLMDSVEYRKTERGNVLEMRKRLA